MTLRVCPILCIAALCSLTVFSQNPVTADSRLQVKYIGNLGLGDAVVNITNTGVSNANICANVYVFSPDEQLISCCSCAVTPNAIRSLTARNDLLNNPLTPAVPSAIVVKLLASSGTCNAAAPLQLSSGLVAWGTTMHVPPFAIAPTVTETAFTPSTTSAGEIIRISTLCGLIQANGSGYGVCNTCRAGALGANKQ